MSKTVLLATALVLGSPIAAFAAQPVPAVETAAQDATIDFVGIDKDITLRRTVVRSAHPKGTILLLHGFPETLHAWDEIAPGLSKDYDVHTFDWPGYGLSSRPTAGTFSYAPRDYARILKGYIDKAGIDRSTLTIYATDIGALPALLLALDEPGIARQIIVGDFAPFNRPQHMFPALEALKAAPASEGARAYLTRTREEVLDHAFHRGLPADARFPLSPAFRADMDRGWAHGAMTSAAAFYHYYSHFTRDQDYVEANLARLKTPVKVVWGERDIYINHAMGREFAQRSGSAFKLLPGLGHYPHLQSPERTIEEIRATAP
jgi:pimeloyl-ACP methyl ester carboxylesterase